MLARSPTEREHIVAEYMTVQAAKASLHRGKGPYMTGRCSQFPGS
jgi:hypothetical protein